MVVASPDQRAITSSGADHAVGRKAVARGHAPAAATGVPEFAPTACFGVSAVVKVRARRRYALTMSTGYGSATTWCIAQLPIRRRLMKP